MNKTSNAVDHSENEVKAQQYLNGFDYGRLYAVGLMEEPIDPSNLSSYFLDGFKEASGHDYFELWGEQR